MWDPLSAQRSNGKLTPHALESCPIEDGQEGAEGRPIRREPPRVEPAPMTGPGAVMSSSWIVLGSLGQAVAALNQTELFGKGSVEVQEDSLDLCKDAVVVRLSDKPGGNDPAQVALGLLRLR